jgi:hypothetical protein
MGASDYIRAIPGLPDFSRPWRPNSGFAILPQTGFPARERIPKQGVRAMRSRTLFAAATLFTCTAGLAAALTIQDKSKTTPPPQDKGKAAPAAAPVAPPGMDPAASKKMEEAATPGAEHKMLASKVGKWKGKGKFWMVPDSPPMMESDVDTEFAMIMGDRFLSNTTHSMMGPQPFEGHGLDGFDNVTKKFVSTWADNMGTGIMTMEGTYDAGSKTLTSSGNMSDPVAGKPTPFKMISKDTDANSFTLEMHCTDPKSGKLFKCMEIAYTRAK